MFFILSISSLAYKYVVLVSGISKQAWSGASSQRICLSFLKCRCSQHLRSSGCSELHCWRKLDPLWPHVKKNHPAQPSPSWRFLMLSILVISEPRSSNERFYPKCRSVVGGISISQVYSELKLLSNASLARCQGVGRAKSENSFFNKTD